MTGIRHLPEQTPRVETGAAQFGDDWPGLFIRGDNAGYYATLLEQAIKGDPDPITKLGLQGLQQLLASAILSPVGEHIPARSKASSLAPKLRVIADFQDEQGNPGAAFTCREAADLLDRLDAPQEGRT